MVKSDNYYSQNLVAKGEGKEATLSKKERAGKPPSRKKYDAKER